MNQNEAMIRQTIEGIGMMYRSLDALRERVLPVNPAMFAVMAQGPTDDLQTLLDDLQKLLAQAAPPQLMEQAPQNLSPSIVLPEAA